MAGGRSNTAARKALEEELGAPPPPGLKALSADETAHLCGAIRDARREHARALQRALNDALGILPGFLRGPVKKAVGG
jgi:hypothetical protein